MKGAKKCNFPWFLVKSLPKAKGNLESFHFFNTFAGQAKFFWLLTPLGGIFNSSYKIPPLSNFLVIIATWLLIFCLAFPFFWRKYRRQKVYCLNSMRCLLLTSMPWLLLSFSSKVLSCRLSVDLLPPLKSNEGKAESRPSKTGLRINYNNIKSTCYLGLLVRNGAWRKWYTCSWQTTIPEWTQIFSWLRKFNLIIHKFEKKLFKTFSNLSKHGFNPFSPRALNFLKKKISSGDIARKRWGP